MARELERIIELLEETNRLLRESNALAAAIARPFLLFRRKEKG